MFTNAITTCYTFVIPYCARQAPASDTTLSVLRLAAAARLLWPGDITLVTICWLAWGGVGVLHIIELFTLEQKVSSQQFNRDFAKSQTCVWGAAQDMAPSTEGMMWAFSICLRNFSPSLAVIYLYLQSCSASKVAANFFLSSSLSTRGLIPETGSSTTKSIRAPQHAPGPLRVIIVPI